MPIHPSSHDSHRGPMIALLIAALFVLGGLLAAADATGRFPPGPAPSPDGEPVVYDAIDYPTNGAGQTYGVLPGEQSSPHDVPDLIRLRATNGLVGYVYATDMDQADPGRHVSNPEEATAFMDALQAGEVPHPEPIPVYESDGTTLIGEFAFSCDLCAPPG